MNLSIGENITNISKATNNKIKVNSLLKKGVASKHSDMKIMVSKKKSFQNKLINQIGIEYEEAY